MYADDFAVLEGSPDELQQLLDMCGTEMMRLRLRLNQAKYVVIAWGVSAEGTRTVWALQEGTICRVETGKYLGVSLNAAADYLNPHECEMKSKAGGNKGMFVRQTLGTFNLHKVLRVLWKMVTVPRLTYANAALRLSTGMSEFLERCRRDVGRMAIRSHRKTPVEANQGELGWSTFTVPEAVAKAVYDNRLLCLPKENLARQVMLYLIFTGRSTRLT